MSGERDLWLGRIKSVEREYYAARFSINRALQQVRQNPSLLTGDLRVREIEHASELLEGTYFIRLFAEFETGLRVFLQRVRRRAPPSRTRDLLDGVAASRGIPNERLQDAHSVREYRNSLLHEREDDTVPIPIKEARGYLCWFFSFLPRSW